MTKKLTLIAFCVLAATAFANPGPPCNDKDFETHIVGNFQYNPVNSDNSWDFFDSSGVAREGGSFPGSLQADDGVNMAFLQEDGAEIAQTISGWSSGSVYHICWSEASRQGYSNGDLQILIGSGDGGTSTITELFPAHEVSNKTYWNRTQTVFTASQNTHRLYFRHSYSGVDDRTTFIDRIRIWVEPTVPPNSFPSFSVPGFEEDMFFMRELFYLHYPVSILGTFNCHWVAESTLWPALEPIRENSTRNNHKNAIATRRISSNGYLSCHQHLGLAHSEGWPFPYWTQSDGWGQHFAIDAHWEALWGIAPTTSDSGWTKSGAATVKIDRTNGWELSLSSANAEIITPNISVKNLVAPFIRLEWEWKDATPGVQPYLEWKTTTAPAFGSSRRIYFDPISSSDGAVYTMIPLYQHSLWDVNDILTGLKINFGNSAGASVNIRSIITSVDSRHNGNNSIYTDACNSIINWTGSRAFITENINKIRLAVAYAIDEFQLYSNKCVSTPWIGHDGRSGIEYNPGKTILKGLGVGNGYWDLLPFGGKDTLATIYVYNALNELADLEDQISKHPEWEVPGSENKFSSEELKSLAQELKNNSTQFWNQTTERFVAAIDINGVAHDYGFTFLNCEAVHYGFANEYQSRKIAEWLDGKRVVAGDTSQTNDIYHWKFGPRATTIRNIDYYNYVWSNPETIPFGGQVQDGGAVLGFTYHDLMTRLKTFGADNTWQRLNEILDWFKRVQDEGGYREYYYDSSVSTRGTLQGGGTAGGLGMDYEFYESVLVPQIMIRGFLGFNPKIDGFDINPKLPSVWPSLTINRIRLQDTILTISATSNSIFISIEGGNDVLKVYPPHDRYEIKYYDFSSNVIYNFTTFINDNNEGIPIRSNESQMVELIRKPMLQNFSFENNGIEITYPGYIVNNPVDAWTFSTASAGRNTSDGPFFGTGKTPDGHNVCFIQAAGSVSQTVSGFEAGVNYKLSLYANAGTWAGKSNAVMEIKLNGAAVIGPTNVIAVTGSEDFHIFSATVSPGTGNFVLEISHTNTGSDFAILIDKVQITKIVDSTAGLVKNNGFEADGSNIIPPGFVSNNLLTGWTYSSNDKIGRNTSEGPFLDNGTVPEEKNICFIKGQNSISQTISNLEKNGLYRISIRANAALSGSGAEQLEVKLGGISVISSVSVSPVGGNNFFHDFAQNFTAASTNLTLEISQANANVNSILLIDDIRVAKVNNPYIANHSFEANGTTGFTWPGYDAVMDNWTKSAVPIGRNTMEIAPFLDNGSVPDGRNACFIQNPGYISQTISGFKGDMAYAIALKANSREGTGGKAGLEIKLDGTTILGPVEVSSVGGYNQFHTFSNSFSSPGIGSFVLQIHQTYDEGGGVNSLTIDDIKITASPIPEPFYLSFIIFQLLFIYRKK
jgi:hypothetical protein